MDTAKAPISSIEAIYKAQTEEKRSKSAHFAGKAALKR
jgi:hypothetical protein